MSSLEEQIIDYRRALEEVTERARVEGDVMEQQSLVVTGRTRELKGELDARELELDAIKDRHRALTREHDATRKDCEGMLKVMEGAPIRQNGPWSRKSALLSRRDPQ